MIVRKIRPQELKRTMELFAIVFGFPNDSNKSAEEVFEEVSKNPRSRDEKFWSERWAAFEDDGQTMMSYFAALPIWYSLTGKSIRWLESAVWQVCRSTAEEEASGAVLRRRCHPCIRTGWPFLIYILFRRLITASLDMKWDVKKCSIMCV